VGAIDPGAARRLQRQGPYRRCTVTDARLYRLYPHYPFTALPDNHTTAAELIAAVTARYRIHDLTLEEPDIEGIVRRIYNEGVRG
jgi:hypothetical protein